MAPGPEGGGQANGREWVRRNGNEDGRSKALSPVIAHSVLARHCHSLLCAMSHLFANSTYLLSYRHPFQSYIMLMAYVDIEFRMDVHKKYSVREFLNVSQSLNFICSIQSSQVDYLARSKRETRELESSTLR